MSFFKNKTKSIANSVSNIFKKKAVNEAGTTVANTPAKPKFRQKVVDYVKLVIRDYGEVGRDSIKYMNENPFKSIGYGLTLGSITLFYKNKPTKIDYDDRRRSYLNDMIMCGTTYNKKSEYYLNELNKLENADLLEYRSYFVFSLILARSFNPDDSTYESHCPQLTDPSKYNIFNQFDIFLRFISRIVDIGFCRKWYILEKRMLNFDVDDGEWYTAKK